MRSLVIILLLATTAALPQNRASRKAVASSNGPTRQWPIETIQVRGNSNFTAQQIIEASGLRVGGAVDESKLAIAQHRLMATGNFVSVSCRFEAGPDERGYAVTLDVMEVSPVLPVRFEDLPAADSEIRQYFRQKDPMFAPRISAAGTSLVHYTTLLTEFLATKNYNEPVQALISSEGGPDFEIVFRPAAPRPNVAEVQFTNTGELKPEDLKLAFYPAAIGSVYTEPHFRELLDLNVRPLYEAHGHLRVTFPKLEVMPARDVKGVVVTVKVEQGPVYKLRKVGFQGVNSPDGLNDLLKLKTRDVANFDEVRAAQGRVNDDFRRKGYLHSKTEIERSLDDEHHEVSVIFRINTGPQFLFGKLIIEGLDIVTEPEIRKLWGLAPGKPFRADYPDKFLRQIREENLFENLKSTLAENHLNEADHTVDVTLWFNKPGVEPQPDINNNSSQTPQPRPSTQGR